MCSFRKSFFFWLRSNAVLLCHFCWRIFHAGINIMFFWMLFILLSLVPGCTWNGLVPFSKLIALHFIDCQLDNGDCSLMSNKNSPMQNRWVKDFLRYFLFIAWAINYEVQVVLARLLFLYYSVSWFIFENFWYSTVLRAAFITASFSCLFEIKDH